MGRFGELYDQDDESPRAERGGGQIRAGHGMLFDQDATASKPPASIPLNPTRREAIERQIDREIEYRREVEWNRERDARRRRATPSRGTGAPPDRLRITSRTGPPVRIGSEPSTSRRDAPLSPSGRPASARKPSPPPTSPGSAGRASAVLAAGTFASRVTGFLRVLAIGYVLGVGSLSDAFNYANGVPNIVYDLLLGGILSATLIPVFVEHLDSGDDGGGDGGSARALSAVVSAIAAGLAVVTVLLWLLAPWVIRFYLLLNPASTGGPERALATKLLHWFAPQVFLLGATVVSTALLNARRNFTAAAFSPVLNNLIAIAALVATKMVASHVLSAKGHSPAGTLTAFNHDERAVVILGLGTTAGYLVQLLAQLPAMAREGLRLQPVWEPRHPAVRKVAKLSSWLLGVVLANQASLALVMVLAGRTEGGVTAYQFSYQFFQLPYALIAVSVASAIMPDLATRWNRGDRVGFERQFLDGLRVTLALIMPAGLLYVAVAQPFIQLAIHHGRVTQSGAHLVGSTLALFAVGLPGFSAFFLLMRGYQAMRQARAMFWIYALENGLTVVLAVALEPVMGVPGLALAWVAPYTIAAVVAGVDLRRRVGGPDWAIAVRAGVRIAIAGAGAAAVAYGIGALFPPSEGAGALLVRLLCEIGAGAAVYLWLAKAMRIGELRRVVRLARRTVG